MPNKPLLPLIITVTILFLAATGLSVIAARTVAENQVQNQLSGDELTAGSKQATVASDQIYLVQPDDIETYTPGESETEKILASEDPAAVIDTTASASIPDATGSDDVDDDEDDGEDEDDDEDEDIGQSSETLDPFISLEEAKAIALAYVDSKAVIVETDLDNDENPPKYEITLIAGSYEYEIEIHAITGSIIDMEREPAEASGDQPDDNEKDDDDEEEDDD